MEVVRLKVIIPVSTEPLRSLLGDPEMERTLRTCGQSHGSRGWVRDVANQVEGYAGAQAQNTAGARPRWSASSARRNLEVCMADYWGLFRQRVNKWIQNLLLAPLGRVARHPMGATILFWVVIVAALSGWPWRSSAIGRDARLGRIAGPNPSLSFERGRSGFTLPARPPRAETSGSRSFVYWAGICYLEDSEVVGKIAHARRGSTCDWFRAPRSSQPQAEKPVRRFRL